MTYGVMGGWSASSLPLPPRAPPLTPLLSRPAVQPQGHVQILLNMLHHNANAQATLDAPRFCISADVPTDEKEGHIGTKVYLEDGVRPEVVEGLKQLGHDVELLVGHERGMFGRGQVRFSCLFLCLDCSY